MKVKLMLVTALSLGLVVTTPQMAKASLFDTLWGFMQSSSMTVYKNVNPAVDPCANGSTTQCLVKISSSNTTLVGNLTVVMKDSKNNVLINTSVTALPTDISFASALGANGQYTLTITGKFNPTVATSNATITSKFIGNSTSSSIATVASRALASGNTISQKMTINKKTAP